MRSPRIRYATRNGVSATISSRVPGTRPSRPLNGYSASRLYGAQDAIRHGRRAAGILSSDVAAKVN
jgi:hypothetical protein